MNPRQFLDQEKSKFIDTWLAENNNALFTRHSYPHYKDAAEAQSIANRDEIEWQNFKSQATWYTDPFFAMGIAQFKQYPTAKMQRGGFKNSFGRLKSSIFGRKDDEYVKFTDKEWDYLTKDIPENQHWRFLYSQSMEDAWGIRRILEQEQLDNYILQHSNGALGLTSDIVAGVFDPTALLFVLEPSKITSMALSRFALANKVLGPEVTNNILKSSATQFGVKANDFGLAMVGYNWLDQIPAPNAVEARDYVHAYLAGLTLYTGFRGAELAFNAGQSMFDKNMSDTPTVAAAAPTGTAAAPTGTAAAPTGTAAAPTGTAAAPTGTAAAPTGTAAAPTGTAAAPTGTAAAPTGTAAAPTGTSALQQLTPTQRKNFENLKDFYTQALDIINNNTTLTRADLIKKYSKIQLTDIANYLGVHVVKSDDKKTIVNTIINNLSNTKYRLKYKEFAVRIKNVDDYTALKQSIKDQQELEKLELATKLNDFYTYLIKETDDKVIDFLQERNSIQQLKVLAEHLGLTIPKKITKPILADTIVKFARDNPDKIQAIPDNIIGQIRDPLETLNKGNEQLQQQLTTKLKEIDDAITAYSNGEPSISPDNGTAIHELQTNPEDASIIVVNDKIIEPTAKEHEQIKRIIKETQDEQKHLHSVHIGNNEKIIVMGKVSDEAKVIQSHNSDGSINQLYEQLASLLKKSVLQPRNRGEFMSVAQVKNIAINLDPTRLDDSVEIAFGSPITFPVKKGNTTYYLVISGNGRTSAIKAAEPEKRLEYNNYFNDKYPELTKNTKKPIYHRVIGEEYLSKLENIADTANKSELLNMSVRETAKNDAQKLTPDMLDSLSINFARVEVVQSLLFSNKEFLQKFVENNIGKNEMIFYFGADLKPNLNLVNRVHDALIYKAFDDKSINVEYFIKLRESVNVELKAMYDGISNGAIAIAKVRQDIDNFNLKIPILEAYYKIREYKEKNPDRAVNIDEILSQTELFGQQQNVSMAQDALVKFYALNIKNNNKIQLMLQTLAEAIHKDGIAYANNSLLSDSRTKSGLDYINYAIDKVQPKPENPYRAAMQKELNIGKSNFAGKKLHTKPRQKGPNELC